MFYKAVGMEVVSLEEKGESVRGLVVLNPSESKRLIARGVAALPEVKRAMEKGRIVVARGSTNAFIAEEILGQTISKINFCAGIVSQGELKTVPEPERLEPVMLENGKPAEKTMREMLQAFDVGDVFIKGANAVDIWGNAGILVADSRAGTIGSAWPTVTARGAILLIAVGLEKLIPSVADASEGTGINRWKYCMGKKVALVPVTNGLVITEVEALEVLTGVIATHIASGGIGGSEGAVTIALDGSDEEVSAAFDLVQSLKGEKPVIGL